MSYSKIIAQGIIALVLLGLSSPQTVSARQKASSKKQQQESPAPVEPYRALIAEKLKLNLKDPYSVRDAGISTLEEGFVGIFNGGNKPVVCVRFNSKNSYGAYTGLTAIAIVIEEGRPVNAIGNAPIACNNRQYAPFPELSTS